MKIEDLNFGEVLNSLRIYKNMDIEDLAKGICTVEEVELFEREVKYPTLDQVAKFAERLGVDIHYLFDFTMTSRFNYVVTISDLISNYRKKRDYQTIFEIVKKEKNNPLFNRPSSKQFLLWHEGICVFYLLHKKESAIHLLKKAIQITNPSYSNLTEREVDILCSIGIIEKDAHNYDGALSVFSVAYKHLRELPYIYDTKLEIKVLYSYAQLLTKVGKFGDSLIYCKEGINTCISSDLLYQFADFHYQSGENYIRLGNVDLGGEYMEKAMTIFELQGNHKYAQLVKTEYKKLLADVYK